MTLTRANAEAILVKRTGDLLVQAGLDGTTVNGTNVDLADPIAYAVRALGYPVANPTTPADADLAGLPDTEIDEFLDLAEVRTLETIHGRLLDLVDITLGTRREVYSQMANGLAAKIERRTLHLRHAYGRGAGGLEAGTIGLQIAQHHEDT